jgi:hypothetical protein
MLQIRLIYIYIYINNCYSFLLFYFFSNSSKFLFQCIVLSLSLSLIYQISTLVYDYTIMCKYLCVDVLYHPPHTSTLNNENETEKTKQTGKCIIRYLATLLLCVPSSTLTGALRSCFYPERIAT